MKRVIYVTFFVSMLAFFSGSVAQDLPRLFSGRIQTVDNANRMIDVMTGDKSMAFQISKDTKIKTDYGDDMPFSQLKITMSVLVEYMKEGDYIHPLSVKVNTLPSGFTTNQRQPQPQPQQFSGLIQNVEEAGRNIVVTDGGKTMVFHIYPATKINVPIADLKSGTPVNVEYSKMGGHNHSLSINASLVNRKVVL